VFSTGFAGELHAPFAMLVTVASLVNVVFPHSMASTVTVSPELAFETMPDSVAD